MMAQERAVIDTAYAGDIIGVFDPGIYAIGDTICSPAHKVRFEGIPTFAPEIFMMVEQLDSMKRKQFAKGMTQIAQEGAIQMFFEPGASMERVTVGVVGTLQFDVLKFRMKSEYNVEYLATPQPYRAIRRIVAPADPKNVKFFDNKWVQDVRGNNFVLFQSEYMIGWFLEQNPGTELVEFGK